MGGFTAEDRPVPSALTRPDVTVLAPNDPAFEPALLSVSGSGGLYQLDRISLFNPLCVPGENGIGTISSLQKFCRDRRAFLIADSAHGVTLAPLQNRPVPACVSSTRCADYASK